MRNVGGWLRRRLGACLSCARFELESHLAGGGIAHQEGGELAPRLVGDEAFEQAGFAGGQQLLHLVARNFLLQDDLAGAEVAALGCAHGFFADVGHAMFEHVGTALGAGAQRRLAGEVDGFIRCGIRLAEIKFRRVVVLEPDHGRKGTPHLAAEALQRADDALAEQLVHFLGFPLAAGDDFPQAVIAGFAFELLVAFLDHAAASRAGRFECREGGFGQFAGLDALDHFTGLVHDVVHEFAARQATMFHLAQLVLPFAGEFRRADFIDAKIFQREQQRSRLGCRLQFAAIAVNVFLGDQAFNRCRARGWCAQAALGHRFAQFFILDQLAGALHRGEQGGFRKTRRRLGGLGFYLDILGPHALVFFQQRQVGVLIVLLRFLAIHRQPARCDQHLAFGLEGFVVIAAFDTRDARGDVVFRRRIENRQETLGDQVVDFLLRLGKAFRQRAGRDDGEVVGHFRIIENALVRVHPAAFQDHAGKWRVGGFSHRAQGFLDGGQIIFRQMAAVGPRVGQRLVLFIQRLGDAQRVLGREAKATVGFALQRGEVVEHRAGFGLGLAFFFDRAMLADTAFADGLGAGVFP